MAHAPQVFRWNLSLRAPPAALWPLVSDTDRFNRDCGYPTVKILPQRQSAASTTGAKLTNTRHLEARANGLVIEWEERAFEWHAPNRFAVERDYLRGPFTRMVMSCDLAPSPEGGTTLVYEMRLTPRGALWNLLLPFAIGRRVRATTERVFRRYDEFALNGLRLSELAPPPQLTEGAEQRLANARAALVDHAAQSAPLVDKLTTFLATADDLTAARMRPYALADDWRADRRETLKLFLHATRAGVLDFSWDVTCPHCRGVKSSTPSLSGVGAFGHCDSCNIDFKANFDQSVELTFTPNAAIRHVARVDYCVGGPQVTPHIVAQQALASGEKRSLPLALNPGRYRVRTPDLPEQHAFRVAAENAPARARIDLGLAARAEPLVDPQGELVLVNASESPHLAIVEHVAWSDQAATAAEATSLQLFRDMFSREVLRPGEQIAVGTMTIVFTDLKGSTQLYQEIGDAPAFGRVLTHFEILKAAIAAEGGAVIKTMGDAVMAVFPRPVSAVRAMLRAHHWLGHPLDYALPNHLTIPPSSIRPLALKAGIHFGPCLAINQNDHLDYFGSVVNLTARLCAACTGRDLVLSATLRTDAEVAALLAEPLPGYALTEEKLSPRGFGTTQVDILRLTAT